MIKLLHSLTLLTTLPLALSLSLPDASNTLNARASSCTPKAGGSSSTDDVPAIASAIASCGNGGTIVIPSGTTYYLNSVLGFAGCTGCDFQIEGLLKFASDTDYWKGRTAMINVENINGIKIRSVSGDGVIDGNGQDAYVYRTAYYIQVLRLEKADKSQLTGTTSSLQTAATNARHSCT